MGERFAAIDVDGFRNRVRYNLDVDVSDGTATSRQERKGYAKDGSNQ